VPHSGHVTRINRISNSFRLVHNEPQVRSNISWRELDRVRDILYDGRQRTRSNPAFNSPAEMSRRRLLQHETCDMPPWRVRNELLRCFTVQQLVTRWRRRVTRWVMRSAAALRISARFPSMKQKRQGDSAPWAFSRWLHYLHIRSTQAQQLQRREVSTDITVIGAGMRRFSVGPINWLCSCLSYVSVRICITRKLFDRNAFDRWQRSWWMWPSTDLSDLDDAGRVVDIVR